MAWSYNLSMAHERLVELLDLEIERLQQARAVLAVLPSVNGKGVGGRRVAAGAAPAKPKKKRNLSPEGRARIAEAARRRWAAQKRATK